MGLRGKKSDRHLNVVQFSEKRPDPPRGMSKTARKLWKEITHSLPAGYFRAGARPLLEAYCEAYSSYVEASRILQEADSLIIETRYTTRPHPALQIMQNMTASMAQLAAKLRLSPSSYKSKWGAGMDERPKPKSKRGDLMFGGVDGEDKGDR